MTGEISNEGDLQAQFIHQLMDCMKFKCVAQVKVVCVKTKLLANLQKYRSNLEV